MDKIDFLLLFLLVSEVPYAVEIKTGDVKNIGAVYLTIYGSKSQIEKMPLNENKTNTKAFEKNKLDEFTFYGIDVGDVGIEKSIEIITIGKFFF